MKLTFQKSPALVLTIAAFAVFAVPATATSIFITNPSFESPSLGGSGYEAVSDGWTGTGIYYAPPSEIYTAAEIPDGTQVLTFGDDPSESDHESVSQTLTTAWAANTTYTLTFYVGAFPSNIAGYSGYVATLSAGSVLAADENGVTPTPGSFTQDTLTYTTGAVAPSGDITIGFADPSEPGVVAIDLVQLNAVTNSSGSVPEPGEGIMVAAGLALLGVTRVVRAAAPSR